MFPSFNRTFLVLKCDRSVTTESDAPGFNRTFLVLKSWNRSQSISPSSRFNRTFLVLKWSDERLSDEFNPQVLIAPFWYWNFITASGLMMGSTVLIAPFWYWNFASSTGSTSKMQRFNRTFLVLKSSLSLIDSGRVAAVLIAPFWYWNRSGQKALRLRRRF